MKLIRWAFWNVVYLFRRKPADFTKFILKVHRTMPLWRKFRPITWHNDLGRYWAIHLADSRDYVSRETITIDVGRSLDTGRITSLKVFDEQLAAKATA